MRTLLLAFALTLSACSAAPAVTDLVTPSAAAPADVAGDWSWTCCSDRYAGTMTLRQSGSRVTGTFTDTVDQSGGDLAGTVDGSVLTFTRTTPSSRQTYTLRAVDGGRALDGTFVGSGTGGTPEAFRAERSAP